MKIQPWKRTVLHAYDMNKVSMTTMFPAGQLVLCTANRSRSEHYVAAMREDKITPNSTTTVAFWTIVFWTCHNLRAPTQSTHYLHGLFAPPPVLKSGWWRFWSTAILKIQFLFTKNHPTTTLVCQKGMCMVFLSELELKQQIERIRNSVSSFKRLLADMKPGPVCKLI